MPQSLTKLYAHLVFSTKNREPWLDDDVRPRVHAYLAEAMRNLGSSWCVVGGVDDHVHVLFEMGRTASPAKIVEELKRESSKFVKTLGSKYGEFFWQRGYGMFSVGPTQIAAAEQYVRNQEEHHLRKSFQEEFRALLQKYDVAFDERYVWD